jgi:hypothetical protein
MKKSWIESFLAVPKSSRVGAIYLLRVMAVRHKGRHQFRQMGHILRDMFLFRRDRAHPSEIAHELTFYVLYMDNSIV